MYILNVYIICTNEILYQIRMCILNVQIKSTYEMCTVDIQIKCLHQNVHIKYLQVNVQIKNAY